jgi:hypothetical protein
MFSRTLLSLALVALVASVGCQTSSPDASSPATADTTNGVTAPAATSDAAAAVSTTDATTQSAAPADATTQDAAPAAATQAAPPPPVSTPTPRPTPRPLPTPIPPGQAVEPAATSLETKLSAFRAALRAQDVNGALKLQRDLVSATSDADTAVKNDKSPQAVSVRGAISQIRSGIGGDANALDHAESALRQVIGGGNGMLGITTSDSSGNPSDDLHTLNVDLHDFQQAIAGKNSGDALRLQGKLLAEVGAAQQSAGSGNSALSDALATLQKGLNGDSTALAVASAQLDKFDTGPGQAAATPDYAGLAASLAAKMDAFETATATASQSDLLRLQQEILAEATQDQAALGSDDSPQAKSLRDAIKSTEASVSGDLNNVDSARATLGKVSGQSAESGASTAKPITDIKGFARDLDNTVGSFQDALQRNDTSSMLRLQKSLADQADQAETSLKGVQSKPAQDVLSAVGAIRSAFAGDTSKLVDARVQLKTVSGGPSAPISSAPAATAGSSKLDSQAVAGGVRDQLNSLQAAIHDPHQSTDEIAKRRDAVNSAAVKAATALQGVNDPRADQLRSALTTAREAAAGDDAKIQSALNALNGQ